jgi:hypothetical protein
LIQVIFIVVAAVLSPVVIIVACELCRYKWPDQYERVDGFLSGVMQFLFGVAQLVWKSQLLGVGVGAFLTYWFSERITEQQYTQAFVEKSLPFVLEFTKFYGQQASYFTAVANLNRSPRPEDKASVNEILKKLSDAEEQTHPLEFKAAGYFHGTEWLEKFERIGQIWSLAEAPTREHYEKLLSGEENTFNDWAPPELSERLSNLSQQLTEKTAELLERFALLLKQVPSGSTVFQHVPSPTPTPAIDFNNPD